MGAIASQITSLTIVYSTVYSDADQRQHQSSASLAFVRVIHRGPVNSPHKWPVTRKMFPFDDVIMYYPVYKDTDATSTINTALSTLLLIVLFVWNRMNYIIVTHFNNLDYIYIYYIYIYISPARGDQYFFYLDVNCNVLQGWYIFYIFFGMVNTSPCL